VSQHLRLLRRLDLVASRRQGRYVYYRLDDDHVAQLVQTSLAHLAEERCDG
jgi:ArsR family transcriptional regulator